MKTKIPMKTIYLILVITIGLVGLGVGSTFAVFTASAEITNPISFSSNLTYNGDIFDTTEVTIGPNSYTLSNISIYNEEQLDGIKYTTWYIYEGSASDLTFEETQDGNTTPSGNDISGGGTVGLKITNNTSNTITITIGVTTSRDDIVLPSYMRPVTISAPSTYNLTLIKGTGVSNIFYKVNGASSYTAMSKNRFEVSLDVTYGTTYYYYGTASTGYTMNSCTVANPCSGTMGTSAVTKSLSATASSGPFTVTLYVDDELIETKSVSGGGKYERSFSAPTSTISCSCTNGQTCSISHSSGVYYMATIDSVTANTTCRVEY